METGILFYKKNIILAAFIYFFISGLLLYHYGIQLGGEAEKYIDNANRILRQDELRNGFFGIFYVAYSLMVALCIKLSIQLVFVAVVQIIFSFIAAVLLYRLLVNVLGNRRVAFLFFIAYLLCYPIQKWNFFLYSESLHTSCLVIGIYLFDKLRRERKYTLLAAFGTMMLLILFSRPVGLLFLFSVAAVMLTWLYGHKKRSLFYLFLGLSIVAIVVIANSPVTAFINPDSLKRMEVICQVPGEGTDTTYQEFNRVGLTKVFNVIKDDIGIGNFLMNGFKKLGCFFGMYRSYYSWQNNLLLLCYTLFYPFVLIGIFSRQDSRFKYVKRLSILYLCLTSVAIFFTCDDWSNRFISPAFPFILILAAAGFLRIYHWLKPVTNTANQA